MNRVVSIEKPEGQGCDLNWSDLIRNSEWTTDIKARVISHIFVEIFVDDLDRQLLHTHVLTHKRYETCNGFSIFAS